MSQPQSKDEYLKRFAENQKYDGFGIDTAIIMPCPFCAAPDHLKVKLLEMEKVGAQGATCMECGRGWKMIFTRKGGGVSFEVVQTSGDEQPDWLPKMRRVP